MQFPPIFIFTFALLISAILSVWFRPALAKWNAPAPLDMVLLGLAVVVGILGGYVSLVGASELAIFAAIAYLATRPATTSTSKFVLTGVTMILALLLAMHVLPGFYNLRLLNSVKLSADATPYTLYANFDKAAVGLVILAFFCKRTESWAEFFGTLKKALPLTALTIVITLGAALALGIVKPDFKLPASIFVFIATNLFFTCIAEEAFFRGLLQEKLSVKLSNRQHGELIAIACSAALFGVVHFAGGLAYMALATLAGLGYACIYSATKRVEAPIIAHFLFNLLHFIGFTYPALA